MHASVSLYVVDRSTFNGAAKNTIYQCAYLARNDDHLAFFSYMFFLFFKIEI